MKLPKRLLIRIGIAIVVAIVAWVSKNKLKFEASDELTIAEVKLDTFTWLKNCKLDSSVRNNDGDSFTVIHEQGKTEFRLYYVDSAESYEHFKNQDRLDKQTKAFGLADREATVALGVEAKNFVINLLKENKFTVATTWANVYGPERKYAYVIVTLGGKDYYLHEILVSKGLVRIHTIGSKLPDGTPVDEQEKKLAAIEAQAKKNRVGAWK